MSNNSRNNISTPLLFRIIITLVQFFLFVALISTIIWTIVWNEYRKITRKYPWTDCTLYTNSDQPIRPDEITVPDDEDDSDYWNEN